MDPIPIINGLFEFSKRIDFLPYHGSILVYTLTETIKPPIWKR